MNCSPTFLRALALTIDSEAGPAGRDTLLRSVGRQMARLTPLPQVASLEALEMEINSVLDGFHWGNAQLTLNEAERCVTIRHSGLPQIGSAGEPPGSWLGAVIEGLYEAWMAQQPGGDTSFTARRQAGSTATDLVLRFERG